MMKKTETLPEKARLEPEVISFGTIFGEVLKNNREGHEGCEERKK
jgi:hypothetical protein